MIAVVVIVQVIVVVVVAVLVVVVVVMLVLLLPLPRLQEAVVVEAVMTKVEAEDQIRKSSSPTLLAETKGSRLLTNGGVTFITQSDPLPLPPPPSPPTPLSHLTRPPPPPSPSPLLPVLWPQFTQSPDIPLDPPPPPHPVPLIF